MFGLILLREEVQMSQSIKDHGGHLEFRNGPKNNNTPSGTLGDSLVKFCMELERKSKMSRLIRVNFESNWLKMYPSMRGHSSNCQSEATVAILDSKLARTITTLGQGLRSQNVSNGFQIVPQKNNIWSGPCEEHSYHGLLNLSGGTQKKFRPIFDSELARKLTIFGQGHARIICTRFGYLRRRQNVSANQSHGNPFGSRNGAKKPTLGQGHESIICTMFG